MTFDGAGASTAPEQRVVVSGAEVAIDFSGVGLLRVPTQVKVAEQDGFPEGTLTGFDLERSGRIVGLFTNGLTKPLGQVALATVERPEALQPLAEGLLRPGAGMGTIRVGVPETDGRGSIVARPVGT